VVIAVTGSSCDGIVVIVVTSSSCDDVIVVIGSSRGIWWYCGYCCDL
jgi:hypothetical protein